MKYLLLFLACLPLTLLAQEKYDKSAISKPVLEIVNAIAKENVLMGSAVGYAGKTPEQYLRFEKLSKTATIKELTALTNHPNGVVRCYAFDALCETKGIDKTLIFDIVKQHLKDEELVERFSGCIMDQGIVGDSFILSAIQENYDTGEPLVLDSIQINELNELVINTKSKLWYRDYYAIDGIESTESNYSRLKSIAVDEKNETALIKLSEYKKEADVPIFLTFYKKCDADDNKLDIFYACAVNFPHPSFFPLLKAEVEKILDDDHFSQAWQNLYTAIAAYKNTDAVEVLNMPFGPNVNSTIRRYHLGFVEDGISTFFNPLYDDLLWKLWEDYNLVIVRDYNYLKTVDRNRAYNLITQCLDKELVPFDPMHISFSLSDTLQGLMIEDLIMHNKELAEIYIIKGIKIVSVLELPAYLEFVDASHDTVFIEPLFERITKEENPHTYLRIVKTLISYKDENINKKILETRRQNPHMNDGWGSRDLDTLLEENNIR